MTDLIIHDDIAEKLQRISEQENRPVEEVLREMIELYSTLPDTQTNSDPLDTFIGAFDDDVPNISS